MPFVVPELAPLIPELQASSRPPVPSTAAPAPTARSTLRLLTPSIQLLPSRTGWSLICHRSPCELISQRPRPVRAAAAPWPVPFSRERLAARRHSVATPLDS